MVADPSGRARASFELKSATYPLLSLVLKTADLADVLAELQARLGGTPDFFDQDLVVVNLTQVRESAGEINFPALIALLRQYRLQPIGAHGGSDTQMQAALAAGLVATPDVSASMSLARSARTQQAGADDERNAAAQAAGAAGAEAGGAEAGPAGATTGPTTPATDGSEAAPGSAATAPPSPAAVPAAAATRTIIIDRPLRSGQRVYARDADLVMLAVVSFGAEVIADGNIHVYAPLRGRAIAGARGNTDARIFTTCLEPQLVSIAGIYRTAEVAMPPEVASKPAQIRLVGETLLMEPL